MSGKLLIIAVSLLARRCFTFLLLLLFFQYAMAQSSENGHAINEYRAIHWGIEDGLSQGETYQMLKDVNGFLWIGTKGGLNRFDGNSFKIYFHDPNNKRTIPSDCTIGGLTEDSLHNIWIGTSKGLSRYDIKADTFTNFLPDPAIHKPSYTYSPFWATKNEIFCIENEFTVTAYNVHSLAKRTLANLGPYAEKFLGPAAHYSIFEEASNSVWMLLRDTGNTGFGLLQISLTDGSKQFFTWDCFQKIKDHNHGSEAMCYDKKRNCIWINSSDGLVQFTLNDKKFYHPEALDQIEQVKGYGRFVGIDMDIQGRVWFATHPKGIIIYDPADQSVKMPFANDTTLQNNVSYRNACIYCDRDGIIWSGTWMRNGIYQMHPFSEVVKQYTADPSNPHRLSNHWVEHIVKADHGKLWMGTNDGLDIFDTRTGLFEVLYEKDLPGIKGNRIIPEVIDTITQKAWLSADRFFEMDMATRKCRPVIFKDAANRPIQSPHIIPQMAYKNGCILRASWQNQNGIFVIDSDSSVARQVLSLPGDKNYVFPTLGEGDSLLFLTGNLSFCNRKGKWIRIATPMDSVDRHRILFNKVDKTYWVVAFQQLIHYSRDFRIIHRYTIADGLPEIPVLSLILDNKSNLWFNTDRAIYQLNTANGTITSLTEKDGFQPQNFSNHMPPAKDDAGNLYFQAGLFGDGFDRISPDKFISPPSSIYLQSLQINEKPFPLSTGVNNLQELSLRYFENKITLETGIIDYYAKGKSRIRYKLQADGKTTNWQYAADYYTIRYENLPPGRYKLVLQASNAANEFNGREKILLIHIRPAFWNTWWFRAAVILSIVALTFGVVRYRLRQKFLQQLEHAEKEKQFADMRQKAAELQHKATELEMQALRAQMNPHFIFNSLNAINRFILQNDKLQASEYLTKFSRLVRLILQNSQAALIPLESELEALKLYLELEALRFNYQFEYKIMVADDLDAEIIKVPPLIIQPYAENAIWHGLMNKQEKGHLDIEIYQQDDDVLCCKITDDGIGRKKALELKSKSASTHKSMGMRITADRIAMLQQKKQLDTT